MPDSLDVALIQGTNCSFNMLVNFTPYSMEDRVFFHLLRSHLPKPLQTQVFGAYKLSYYFDDCVSPELGITFSP